MSRKNIYFSRVDEELLRKLAVIADMSMSGVVADSLKLFWDEILAKRYTLETINAMGHRMLSCANTCICEARWGLVDLGEGAVVYRPLNYAATKMCTHVEIK